MSDLVPNLDRLRNALPDDSPALELLAAFEAVTVLEADAELRRLLARWEELVDNEPPGEASP